MERFAYSVLLTVLSLAGFAHAQAPRPSDGEVKKEILKIETDKMPILLRGGPEYADYFDRFDADGVVITLPDGSLQTKAEASDSYRTGEFKVLAMRQFDYQVHVHNGTTAVLTYRGIGTFETKGKAAKVDLIFDDVWVNQHGKWLRIVHNLHNAPMEASNFHP